MGNKENYTGGWIRIYSKFLRWEWFDNAEMVRFFIYLLLSASYKDTSWRGVPIKRGQLLTSRAKICRDTGLTEQQTKTCIFNLKSTGEITTKATNKYTIITICKYEEYQNKLQDEQPAKQPIDNQQSNQQTTSKTTSKATTITEEQNIIIKEISISKDIDTKKSSQSELPSVSGETEAPTPPPIPFTEIKDMWNRICTSYPRLVVMPERRKNKIRVRVEEMGGIEKARGILEVVFGKVQGSNFMKGDNKKGWKANFDWVFENTSNWVKVYEGNYDNKEPGEKAKKDVNDLWM